MSGENRQRNIIIVVVVLVLLCLCCSLIAGVWYAFTSGLLDQLNLLTGQLI